MSDTTNPVDGEAMPEVVDDHLIESDGLESMETNQDDDPADDFADPDDPGSDEGEADDLEDLDWEGKSVKVPKGIKDAVLRHDDYTRKTQAVAERSRAVEAREQSVQQAAERQQAFVQDIAQLGALNARLAPFQQVQDWPTYLRSGGAEAQAHYAEYLALVHQRDQFAQNLGQRVQQQTRQDLHAQQQAVAAGRVELAKHIKGYGPETLSNMEAFAAPFGFSPEEIRDSEADPRSLRILHLAMVGQRVLQQQKRTSTTTQASKTAPVRALRGSGGRLQPRPDTDDFSAFERSLDERSKSKR